MVGLSSAIQWVRVHGRERELRRMIATYQQVRVAWFQELAYIERTGRLDWVDPNPIRVHVASAVA